MEETETPHPEYLKGFNEGYTLAEHMPELSQQLSAAIGNTDRGQGFKDGRAQSLFEQTKIKYPSWLKNDCIEIDNDKDITKEIDREKE